MPEPISLVKDPNGSRPERRWSDSQLAAVVQAAYILEALGR